MMNLESNTCQNLDRALSLEWLEANGRGGFASGTVAGPNTRRYHALLLMARNPPVDRVVLVNHVEEWLTVGDQRVALSTNLYPGAVYPEGYRLCVGFALNPWPTWTYEVGGVRLTREIACVRGRDLVVVRWRIVEGAPGAVRLEVRPMLSGRDYHGLHRENGALAPQSDAHDGVVMWHPYAGLPAVVAHHDGEYRHGPDWFRRLQFPVEQARGLDGEEDWWSPGELTWSLSRTGAATLLFTTESVEAPDPDLLLAGEAERRRRWVQVAPSHDPLVRTLWAASETFISERGAQQTVVAGYPWFTDWGRDTFIALPGLCLVTGRHEVARQVIEAFAPHVSRGMIPNRFPDQGEQPEYNTIDASLWFVHAVGRYWEITRDDAFVQRVAWPAVRQILDGYRNGTRFGIRRDADGLITGGERGAQLTWMDAKVGDWVVTPRHGKPVEIQALWIRALAVAEQLADRFDEPLVQGQCRTDRRLAEQSFSTRFWYRDGGFLYDVIDGPDGDDATLRPNQLYALALVDGLVPKDRAAQVLDLVRSHLLTPVGLRTLPPGHPAYRGRYEGGVWDRDGAYHQGTAWPFLLGIFVAAWIKVHGSSDRTRRDARGFLGGIESHLLQACLGQVSEIFDAEPPHVPRGCIAQAWSVAEPLRALLEDCQPPRADANRPSSRRPSQKVGVRSRARKSRV